MSRLLYICATASWLAASAAFAADPPSTPAPQPKPAASDAELAKLAGGKETSTAMALTEQDLTAVNSGNTITAGSVTSGAITLRDNAFSGFNGVGNIIMNTGHNNNLQSSMSVTIVITP